MASRLLPHYGACLVLTICFLPSLAGADDEDSPEAVLDRQLKVQAVIEDGSRLLLLENNPAKAVEVLEKHLFLIDGNKAYLLLLRDSYKKHIINLYLNDQTALAQKYLNRLRILDPLGAEALGKSPSADVAKTGVPAPQSPTAPPAAKPPLDSGPVQPVVRASMGDEPVDPFAPENALNATPKPSGAKMSMAQALLANAETKFNQAKYHEARLLFEKAYQSDSAILTSAGTPDRWAYCKFQYVVEQLKQPAPAKSLPDLESEVKSALALKPNAKVSQQGLLLLDQIAQRQAAQVAPALKAAVQVKHLTQGVKGWQVAETSHFRIYHNQSKDFVEQAAQIAESTRTSMTAKWFGPSAKNWQAKCEIYLHATGKEYNQKTGVPPQSPGHSRIETDNSSGAVIARQLELRCDNPDLLTAVLPHETTHAILAGQFGQYQVPRWVDEGVAVLTEPAHKINMHLKNLPQHQDKHELFHVGELIEMKDYPHPSRIGAFYAQSVSLVQFLAMEKSPLVFSQFVQDGLAKGYESSLRKHYNIQSYQELQGRWMQHVVAGLNPSGAGGFAKK